jgi:hypothetical protein
MISREPTIERLATARQLLLEPFGLDEPTWRCAGRNPRAPGGRRRPLLPVHPRGRLEPGRGHRQDRLLLHRPGRGRARGQRREDRFRLFRRHFRSLAAGCRAHRALHLRATQSRKVRIPKAKIAQPLAVRRLDPIARWTARPRSSCWARSKSWPAPRTRAWCRSWPAWPASTTWCWWPVPTARWRPTCARWCACR